jgi:hypothetical protein
MWYIIWYTFQTSKIIIYLSSSVPPRFKTIYSPKTAYLIFTSRAFGGVKNKGKKKKRVIIFYLLSLCLFFIFRVGNVRAETSEPREQEK